MNDDIGIWATIGSVIGSGAVGAALSAWWRVRKEKRADAADSANAKAEIRSLADFERRAKESEAQTNTERTERLAMYERAVTAEAKLFIAVHDIIKLQHRLDDAGIPHSDYGALVETNFGELPSGPK